MSRRNDPTPVNAASVRINDACDWLSEIIQGGLDEEIRAIAMEMAEECFIEARQIMSEAAFTTEPIGKLDINGQEFVEYREVVANRLALKALELFNGRLEPVMECLAAQCRLPQWANKRWLSATRRLLPEFCSYGFAAPEKQEPPVSAAAGTGLTRWLFPRGPLFQRPV